MMTDDAQQHDQTPGGPPPPEGPRKETRSFRLHEYQILRDLITRQTGTLVKSLLETVMNAADARATEIDITITGRRLTIVDNGKGFESREQIEKNFEVFGQPQTEEEAATKLYGEFRMGRGQVFHFGHNTWRTATFKMAVDVQKCIAEKKGFEYDLYEGLADEPGCHITVELYRPLSQRDVSETAKELRKRVRYVPANIRVNGQVATVDPKTEKWTVETDDAYIRMQEHGRTLEVFNRGIFVEEFQRSRYGAAGVIVSKRKITVNFARNEIVSSCPVWRRISDNFDARAERRIKQKFTLDPEERAYAIARLVSGELDPHDAWQMQVLVDACGQPWAPTALARASFPQFTVAFRDDPRADSLIQSGVCLVLDQETVDLFELDDPSELFTRFKLLRHHVAPVFVPYDRIAEELSVEFLPVPKRRWTPTERVWLEIMSSVAHNLLANDVHYRDDENHFRRAADLVENPRRVIRIGSSKVTRAWTDGRTYIFVAREWLEDLEAVKHDAPYYRDLFAAGQVLAAQFAFSDDSRRGGHTPEFHRVYYELSKLLPGAVAEAAGMLTPARYDQLKKRVTAEYHRDQRQPGGTAAAEGPAAEAGEQEHTNAPPEEWPDVIGERGGAREDPTAAAEGED